MERLTSCVLASCCLLAMGCASQKLDQSKYQVQFPDTEKIDLTVALALPDGLTHFTYHEKGLATAHQYALGPLLSDNIAECARAVFRKVVVIDASNLLVVPPECDVIFVPEVKDFEESDSYTAFSKVEIVLTMDLRVYTAQRDMLWSSQIAGRAPTSAGTAFDMHAKRNRRIRLLMEDLHANIYRALLDAEPIRQCAPAAKSLYDDISC